MDEIAIVILLLLLGLGVAAMLLVLPIVAVVKAGRARRQSQELREYSEQLYRRVRELREVLIKMDERLARLEADGVITPAQPEAPAPEPEPEEPAPEPEAEAPAPRPSLDRSEDVHLTEPPPLRIEESLAARSVDLPVEADPERAASSQAESPRSLEEKIGLIWFTRIGALIAIVVVGWFFKYMVDNEWIGPWGRVAIGAVVGAGLLAWGEFLDRRRKHTHPYFVQGVLGIGLSILLITTYASFAFYHLVPVVPAFVAVAVLCLLGGALSVTHRSEPILILSLLAVFLNPVMLSTGVDRPLALFAYLLVMTSGALVVAARFHFRVATWIAVSGVTALFAGWYGRFFNPCPPPAPGIYDVPPEEMQGAYYALTARWVPLLFAAVFPIQWVAVAAWMKRLAHKVTPVALFLMAAVASHAAYAALLYDHPLILGGVLCGLAAAFAVLLIKEDHADWMGLPMLASFAVLAGLTGEFPAARLLPMMVLTGGVTAIYFGVFMRSGLKSGRLSSARSLLLMGGAGLGMIILSALYMMPDHFQAFSLLLTVLGGVFLLLAVVVRSVAVLLGTFIVGLLGLTTAGAECQEVQVGFLLIAAAWFLLHMGFLAWDFFVKDSPWSGGRLTVLAGSGLGFTALMLMSTPESAEVLRASLALGQGILYLVFGARMLRIGRYGQDRALMPLGLAVTYFTMAMAFLLSGPSVTVVWAVEGAVLAWLATKSHREDRAGHPAWLVGALLVFGVSLLRFLIQDLPWLNEQLWQFSFSQGKEGVLIPTAFAHPRAWSLIALGLTMLASARALARGVDRSFFKATAGVLAVLGHMCLLGLFIGEAQILFTDWPAMLPTGLPADEFRAMFSQFSGAIYAQATRMQMVTTIVMGLYAAALLVIGFAFQNALHRILGICLFGITLLKLGLYDIWSLETIFKIAVGAAIATLLLAGGYLYARFSDRIKSLIIEGGEK